MSDKRALFIVNDTYSEGLVARPQAGADALQLRDALQGDFAAVDLLHNADQRSILKRIKTFASDNADLHLLYISTHLLIEDDHLYFAADDTEPDLIDVTAISQDRMTRLLDDVACPQQCVILDCTLDADTAAAEVAALIEQTFALPTTGEPRTRLVLWDGGVTGRSYLSHYIADSLVRFPQPVEGLTTFKALFDYCHAMLAENQIDQAIWQKEFQSDKTYSIITSETQPITPDISRIFFSYKREDEAVVQRFYDEMQSRGADAIWMDRRRLKPGDDWAEEIDVALEKCTHLVLFVSKFALFSPVIAHEVTMFERLSTPEKPRTIIPVLLDGGVIGGGSLADDPELNRGEQARIDACHTLEKVVQRINWLSTTPFDQAPDETFLLLSRSLPKVAYRLPELVHVPAGEFIMGERGMERTVHLDEFWISRWTITVGEFVHFFRANGLKSTALFPPAFDTDAYRTHRTRAFWPQEDLDDYALKHTNEPMRGLPWLQAYAYCEWLNRVTDEPGLFHLPTSAQWEKAARGTAGHKFPWGDRWQPGVANTVEAGHGQVLACGALGVGGNSPYGCQDMAGNVWEWTLSTPFDLDESLLLTEDLPRVIRGGDYNGDQSTAWTYASASEDMMPVHFPETIGMRVITTRFYSK